MRWLWSHGYIFHAYLTVVIVWMLLAVFDVLHVLNVYGLLIGQVSIVVGVILELCIIGVRRKQ